jgi:hypothetical protein
MNLEKTAGALANKTDHGFHVKVQGPTEGTARFKFRDGGDMHTVVEGAIRPGSRQTREQLPVESNPAFNRALRVFRFQKGKFFLGQMRVIIDTRLENAGTGWLAIQKRLGDLREDPGNAPNLAFRREESTGPEDAEASASFHTECRLLIDLVFGLFVEMNPVLSGPLEGLSAIRHRFVAQNRAIFESQNLIRDPPTTFLDFAVRNEGAVAGASGDEAIVEVFGLDYVSVHPGREGDYPPRSSTIPHHCARTQSRTNSRLRKTKTSKMAAAIRPHIGFSGPVGPECPIFIAFIPQDRLNKGALLGVRLPEIERVGGAAFREGLDNLVGLLKGEAVHKSAAP